MATKTKKKSKVKVNLILSGLPSSLKDPKKYKEVEQKIKLMMISDHKHPTVKAYIKCVRCMDKLRKKGNYIKEVGFVSYAQYLEWRKVMSVMTNGNFETK